MASSRDVRDLLLESFDDGEISEDEFLLLYDANTSKDPDFPYECYRKFELEDMDDSECLAEFRFHNSDIPVLFETLQLPQTFTCQQGTVCDGMENLCIALRRFARQILRFGCLVPELSMISNLVMGTIYAKHNHRIAHWNHTLLNPRLLERYAEAVHVKGSPLPNCFGFIEGTVRPICRPGEDQRIVYNGHKHVHALKYQSFALPNDMRANMHGPVEGRKHDSGMLTDSDLLCDLEQHAFSTTGDLMALNGDPAYPLRVHLQNPFRGAGITREMQQYNKAMSAVRMSVE